MENKIVWPRHVYVLDVHDLRGGIAYPGCDENNNPTSAWLWMHSEVRLLPMPGRFLHMLCDAWSNRFTIMFGICKTKHYSYTLPDLYNATWASFGYTENQCPKALKLLNDVKPFMMARKKA